MLARIIIFFLLVFSSFTDASASKKVLADIELYLNQLRTLEAKFKQRSPNGTMLSGNFYLWRPGLMRLEYNPPSQELIIADGTYLTHIIKDINEESSVAIDSTPAAILLGDRVDFEKDVSVVALEFEKGQWLLTLKREDDDDAELTLVFNAEPLILTEWIVKDAESNITHVVLDSIKTGVRLDKSLFKK